MRQHSVVSAISLLCATGTLVCCALPALLVMLGFGAVMASVVTAVPGLVWLSEHKDLVFSVAFFTLMFASWLQWRRPADACDIRSPERVDACRTVNRFSRSVTIVAWIFFVVGAAFAFVIPRLL